MPRTPDFRYDVFLSYNSGDKPRVRRLAERLKASGLQVWFDEWVIRPGDDIYLAIERGLEAARVQLLCLSPAALGSDWVTLERSTVLFRDPANSGRRFIPLLLADCALPDALRRYKHVDFREDAEAAFEELLKICRVAMEEVPEPLPPTGERHGNAAPRSAAASGKPEPLSEFRTRLLAAGGAVPELDEETRQVLLRHAPATVEEYRLARVAEWSQPRFDLDKRFTRLTLLLDQGPEAQGARWQAQSRPEPFDDLRDVLKETDATALVLLGPPGCGKSTLLRRLELDLALDALRAARGCVENSRARPNSTCSAPRSTCACCWPIRVVTAGSRRAGPRSSPASCGRRCGARWEPATPCSSPERCWTGGITSACCGANGAMDPSCRRGSRPFARPCRDWRPHAETARGRRRIPGPRRLGRRPRAARGRRGGGTPAQGRRGAACHRGTVGRRAVRPPVVPGVLRRPRRRGPAGTGAGRETLAGRRDGAEPRGHPRRPGRFRSAAGRPRHRLGRDLRPGRHMTRDPAGFVAALEAPNLPLAGRCAAQADVPIPPAQRQRLQQALMARSRDPEADLRARIAAARALGDLGDPRFERRRGPEGEYLLPPLVPIAGGEYPLGSDEGLYENEDPVHTVTLAPYAIGRFPVTNAEWQCFLDGRGYEDECWWDTEAGRRWRRGEDTAEGPKRQWRDTRRYFQDKPDRIGKALAEARIISKQAENYESYRTMADAEFEALLDTWYPPGRQTRPALWDDPASTIRPSRWWAPAGTRRGPMRLALGAERAGVPAADGSGMGRRRRGAGKGTATRGARRSTRPAAMLWRPMSAPPHRWASFPAATDRRVLRIWRATSGSGPGASMLPIPTGPMTAEKTRRMPRPDGWCAAAPGSTTEPPRAAPSAATARPATATSTWGCGWCVWLPSPEPLATGALRSVPLVF